MTEASTAVYNCLPFAFEVETVRLGSKEEVRRQDYEFGLSHLPELRFAWSGLPQNQALALYSLVKFFEEA